MRTERATAIGLPSSYPPESYVRARRGGVLAADIRTRAVLRRQVERSTDAWADALALVEHVQPLGAVDTSEPVRCGKREDFATCARGVRGKARARG